MTVSSPFNFEMVAGCDCIMAPGHPRPLFDEHFYQGCGTPDAADRYQQAKQKAALAAADGQTRVWGEFDCAPWPESVTFNGCSYHVNGQLNDNLNDYLNN